ncbi:hypothetical protein R80B4_01306 [Fibrobacteres bacterium R8-0-B4]
MNLFARQVRTLMTAATAAAVVAAGWAGAGCAKKLGRETVSEIYDIPAGLTQLPYTPTP